MLWNVVYDFYVMYIFGGYDSQLNSYDGFIGGFYNGDEQYLSTSFQGNATLLDSEGSVYFLPLGNYLSLIATIITMVAILLFCIFLIKKIIGVMFRLFTFGA